MMPACRFIPGARPTLIAGLGVLLLLTAAAPRPADSHAITDETPRIAIISAFAPELAILKSDLEDASVVSVNGVTFSTGTLEGHEVVLFLSGISVVNAAMTTQLALDHFAIRDVVFSGIAGGVDPGLNIGDVVIADRWGQYLEMLFARETDDGWATMPFFEYPYGNFDMMFPRSVTVLRPGAEHPETRFWFAADDQLLASARTMADKVALSRCTTEGSCLEEAPRIVIGGSGVSRQRLCRQRRVPELDISDLRRTCAGHGECRRRPRRLRQRHTLHCRPQPLRSCRRPRRHKPVGGLSGPGGRQRDDRGQGHPSGDGRGVLIRPHPSFQTA